MTRFPSNTTDPRYKPLYGLNVRPVENVKRNSAEMANTQNRDVWGVLKWVFDPLTFELPQRLASDLLYEYEQLRMTTFSVFDPIEKKVVGRLLGTGNGATLGFPLFADRITNLIVYVAGVVKTGGGVHYNYSPGTYIDGQDRIIFTAGNAPGAGAAVTADYYGCLLYTCEFTGTPSERSGIRNNTVRLRFPIAEAK